MKMIDMRRLSRQAVGACLALLSHAALAAESAAPLSAPLPIYAGRPLDAFQVTVADFEAQARLQGESAVVPKPDKPKVAASRVAVQVSGKDSASDALTLSWKDAWYSSLRFESQGGQGVDLRPYMAQGVVAFDLNVLDLAKGGLSFKISCGKDCDRIVPFVLPGRALAGKGWQHLVLSLRCFARDGDDFSAISQPFALEGGGAGSASIANINFAASGTPNTACPDYKTVSVTPDMLNESWSIDWWLPRHQDKLAEITRVKDSQIVFIGDSITQGWEKEGASLWQRHYKQYKAINLGYGGDRTENVLWRLQHGEVDGLKPKVAVLMVGTNNTGHRQEDPKTTAAGVKRILDELRQRLPATKILLLAIFPRDEFADGAARRINDGVNALLPGFADKRHIFFLNVNQAFLDKDGVLSREIMPDLLHPNEAGYARWVAAMRPTLQQLMRQSR